MRTVFLLLLLFSQDIFSQSYDAEILESRTKCLIRNGRLTTEKSYKIKIFNSGGERFTKITIPYSKDEPASVEAHIEDKNGNIVRKLNKNEIISSSDQSTSVMFSDAYNYSFTLRHNTFPYIIYFKYVQSSKGFFSIADWTPVYDTRIPTNFAELEIITPARFNVTISERGIKPHTTDSSKDVKIYRWNSEFRNPIKNEVYTVHPVNYYPIVRIRPVNFFYGTEGSHNSWETYGNWEASLMTDAMDLPSPETEKVKSLTSGCRNDVEKIHVLYHYMQDNTRYINVDIGIGGWKPYPASYVAEKKYGDCKALSNYMCSLLAAAGIKAFYTNIYAGEIYPETDLGNFNFPVNHAMVCIPLPTDTIWLECTNNICPAGYLGSFTQGRQAFIIEKDNSRFLKTPALRMDEVKNLWNLKFEVSNSGTVNSKMNFCFRGEDFELLNSVKNFMPKEEQENFIYEIIGLNDFTINKWELKHQHRDSAFINLSIDLSIPNHIKNYGNMTVIKPLSLPVPDFQSPEKRKTEVFLPYPLYTVDSSEYALPMDYKSIIIPGDTVITSEFGIYQRHITAINPVIKIYKSIKLYSARYSLEQYSAFYKFISSVSTEEKKVITLKNQ